MHQIYLETTVACIDDFELSDIDVKRIDVGCPSLGLSWVPIRFLSMPGFKWLAGDTGPAIRGSMRALLIL